VGGGHLEDVVLVALCGYIRRVDMHRVCQSTCLSACWFVEMCVLFDGGIVDSMGS
jgi:hypothetical protein